MLAPDPTGTISQLTLVLNANVAVTQWVMALEAASLPQLNPAPSWYTQVSAALTAAQNDSRGWLTTTGPDIQGEMTQTFINYANLFALVAPENSAPSCPEAAISDAVLPEMTER